MGYNTRWQWSSQTVGGRIQRRKITKTQFSLMFFLCKHFLVFCDLPDTCHMSFNLHLLFWFFLKILLYHLLSSVRSLAYYRPVVRLITLLLLSTEALQIAPAKSVSYSKLLQNVPLLLLPSLMRCLNKSGIVLSNRNPLESIEVIRGNTATHFP